MTFLGTYRISIIQETCREKNIFGFYVLYFLCLFEIFYFYILFFEKYLHAKLREIIFKKIRVDWLTLRELGFAFQFDELSFQTALLGGP